MSNRKYISGRNFEYKIKQELEEDGFTVIRASGSHGVYDLVGFKYLPRSNRVVVRCIQCKVTSSNNANGLKKEFVSSVPFDVDSAIIEQQLAVKTKGHKNYDLYTLDECKEGA